MKITLIASEANPFVKVNDLGEMVYNLAKGYVYNEHEVSVIIPLYSSVKKSLSVTLNYLSSFKIKLGPKRAKATISYAKYEGITYYFVENDDYFARRQVYGEVDDGERFAFFALACIEMMKRCSITSDIIHIHDWEVGMIPCVIKENKEPFFKNTKFVFTIHDASNQGVYSSDFVLSYYGVDRHCFDNGSIEMYGQCSTLKAGVTYADKITATSVNHREELLTKEGGNNLDHILTMRKSDFIAVPNGVDYSRYSPENDRYIATYNNDTFFKQKALNKEALLNRFGLRDSGLPVYGFISSLYWQKGLDIIYPLVRNMAYRGCIFILMGSGDQGHEQGFEQLKKEYPNNVAVYIGYDEELAHLVLAGSDYMIMPSTIEPSGLNAMIAQRYGTLPIVRLTGGFVDNVIPYNQKNTGEADGFGFLDNNYDAFIGAVYSSFESYYNLIVRKKLIKNAMKKECSLQKSVEKYLEIYKSIDK